MILEVVQALLKASSACVRDEMPARSWAVRKLLRCSDGNRQEVALGMVLPVGVARLHKLNCANAGLARWTARIAMDKKVDFLICGTQKGGTTALDAYLRTHPELCMASCKEVHFFDRNEFFPASEASYDWYHANFSNADKKKIWGEATPIYMYWDPAPQRINEYNPKIKIIITLRNPVERAYSHWNMEFKRSWDHVSFSEALMTEKERIAQAFPEQHRVYSYTDRGFYVKQLERLFGYFGRKNVLVIKSESLKQHPRSCLNDVCGFLGVDDFGPIEPMTVNARNYPGAMAESDLRYLQSMFEREIKALERLLGWDCSDWLEARQVACA